MTTGSFWDLTNPDKPFGVLDPDDVVNVPVDFSAWLTGQGTTYTGHAVDADPVLEAVTVAANGSGGIVLQVAVAAGATVEPGEKYPLTCQVQSADGQKRSQTLYFKIKEL